MAGIESAQKGMLSLNVTTAALAVGLGVLIKIGKDGVENYKAQEEALKGLDQAFASQNQNLALGRQMIEEFIATNARFITNQYDVIKAFAAITRAGHSETEAMRILNDALDWSVIKHEDVSVAAETLVKVLAGNSRALKELGITTEQYNAIMKDKTIPQSEKYARILALIEAATAKGRDTTDSATQSQDKLTIAWQNLTAKTGPSILKWLAAVTDALSTGVDILTIYAELIQKIHDLGAGYLSDASKAGATASQQAIAGGRGRPGGRAGGGPVQAGEAYTVGEHGPETLVMGSQGGNVVPNGAGRGGGNLTLIIQGGMFMDHGPTIDAISNALLRHARFRPGT